MQKIKCRFGTLSACAINWYLRDTSQMSIAHTHTRIAATLDILGIAAYVGGATLKYAAKFALPTIDRHPHNRTHTHNYNKYKYNSVNCLLPFCRWQPWRLQPKKGGKGGRTSQMQRKFSVLFVVYQYSLPQGGKSRVLRRAGVPWRPKHAQD